MVPAGDAAAKDKRLEPEALSDTDMLELRVHASDKHGRPSSPPATTTWARARGAAVQSIGLMLGIAT